MECLERFYIKVIKVPDCHAGLLVLKLFKTGLLEFSTLVKARDFILGKFSIVLRHEEDYNDLISWLGRDNLELVDPIQWREWEESRLGHCEVHLSDVELAANEWYGNLPLKEKTYVDILIKQNSWHATVG